MGHSLHLVDGCDEGAPLVGAHLVQLCLPTIVWVEATLLLVLVLVPVSQEGGLTRVRFGGCDTWHVDHHLLRGTAE
jgi:hypothetical protein